MYPLNNKAEFVLKYSSVRKNNDGISNSENHKQNLSQTAAAEPGRERGTQNRSREGGKEQETGKDRRGTADAAYSIQTDYEPEDAKSALKPQKTKKYKSRKPQKKQGAAYLQTFKSLPEPACLYVDNLLRERLSPFMDGSERKYFFEHTKYAFKHVLTCGLNWQQDDYGWVPLSKDLLQDHKPHADMLKLVDAGLLDMREHDRQGHKCREFKVNDNVRACFDRIVKSNLDAPRYDLFTSKRTTRKEKTGSKDVTGNPFPKVISVAVKTIEAGKPLWNVRASEQHLQFLEQEMRQAAAFKEHALSTYGEDSPEYIDAEKKAKKALIRHGNDDQCLASIHGQTTEDLGNGIITYHPAFDVTGTGRLSFKGGGPQSCTREMKAAGYSGLPVEIHNYDIKSSQAYIIRAFLKDANLPTQWLDEYLNRDKEAYAARAGLPVEVWKRCFYALLMGATLPQIDNIRLSKGKLHEYIEEHAGVDQLESAYADFRAVVAPLYEMSLKPWHTYLVNEWSEMNKYPGHKGDYFVRNATGRTFRLDSYETYELDRKLAAFLLQGQEAFFIHTLTGLAEKYGYRVIANEHDGLVTVGEIPPVAVTETRFTCGMPYVEMVEKPFHGYLECRIAA